jgi:hypothetical protein
MAIMQIILWLDMQVIVVGRVIMQDVVVGRVVRMAIKATHAGYCGWTCY